MARLLGEVRRRSIKWRVLMGLSQAAQAPSAGQPGGGLSPISQSLPAAWMVLAVASTIGGLTGHGERVILTF